MAKLHAPLDPDCPDVREQHDSWSNDPMMTMSGCFSEFWEDFENSHRADCQRCKEFGVANIDIVD